MKLPSNWDEISIGQYIELRPFIEMEADTPFKLIDKTIAQLCVLSGQTKAEVSKIRASDVRQIQEDISWINELPTDEIPEIFKVKDRWYTPTLYKEDMSAGQFMAVTELLKESEDNPEVTWQQLHYILVNVCIEVDEKGNKIEIENESKWITNTANDFYDSFPFSIAYPIAVFFCQVSKALPSIIQDFSLMTVQKKIQEAEDLLKDGDGIQH
jgi:hypothetical protein